MGTAHRPQPRARCLMRLLILFLLSLPFGAHAANAPVWNAQSVLHAIASTQVQTVQFSEEKFLGVLDTPLLSQGVLTFRPPDGLEKHTTAPQDELMTLQGQALTYTRQGKTYQLDLTEHPEAAAYAVGIRALLTGDIAVLQRSYLLQLSGDAAHWSLQLLPTDPRLLSLIKAISVTGSGGYLHLIEYDQADGDRSVMTLAPESKAPAAP
ncbi:MAG: hypothetical protein B7Y53_00340 [Halothiobacillus sp. 28-55-5]|nr:MAG: hypothetical protein B7Y53_00340 [Halothiobacillus sp. 28-55-5]